jgi:hypothetical protein
MKAHYAHKCPYCFHCLKNWLSAPNRQAHIIMHSSKTWKPVYCPRCRLGFLEDGSFAIHRERLCDFAEQPPPSPIRVSCNLSTEVNVGAYLEDRSKASQPGAGLSYMQSTGIFSGPSEQFAIYGKFTHDAVLTNQSTANLPSMRSAEMTIRREGASIQLQNISPSSEFAKFCVSKLSFEAAMCRSKLLLLMGQAAGQATLTGTSAPALTFDRRPSSPEVTSKSFLSNPPEKSLRA